MYPVRQLSTGDQPCRRSLLIYDSTSYSTTADRSDTLGAFQGHRCSDRAASALQGPSTTAGTVCLAASPLTWRRQWRLLRPPRCNFTTICCIQLMMRNRPYQTCLNFEIRVERVYLLHLTKHLKFTPTRQRKEHIWLRETVIRASIRQHYLQKLFGFDPKV